MLQDWIGAGTSSKFFPAMSDRGDTWSGRNAEAEPCGIADGIVFGTRIATPEGWRAVERLQPGDLLLTFDYGLQPVAEVRRSVLWSAGEATPRHARPVQVPPGAIGNRGDLLLLPEQLVMVEDDIAETLFDDPFALVPAALLEGYRCIRRVLPERRIEVASLVFEREQIVYADGSALLHAPARAPSVADLAFGDAGAEGYARLPRRDVEHLVACLKGAAIPEARLVPPAVMPALFPRQSHPL